MPERQTGGHHTRTKIQPTTVPSWMRATLPLNCKHIRYRPTVRRYFRRRQMCSPHKVTPGMSPRLAQSDGSMCTLTELAAGHDRLSASLPSVNACQLLEVMSCRIGTGVPSAFEICTYCVSNNMSRDK